MAAPGSPFSFSRWPSGPHQGRATLTDAASSHEDTQIEPQDDGSVLLGTGTGGRIYQERNGKVTIDAETTLGKATREMLRNRVHHLPVVDSSDRLIGIVSTMDILSEFADGAPD